MVPQLANAAKMSPGLPVAGLAQTIASSPSGPEVPHGFADGLQSLLAAIGGPEIDAAVAPSAGDSGALAPGNKTEPAMSRPPAENGTGSPALSRGLKNEKLLNAIRSKSAAIRNAASEVSGAPKLSAPDTPERLKSTRPAPPVSSPASPSTLPIAPLEPPATAALNPVAAPALPLSSPIAVPFTTPSVSGNEPVDAMRQAFVPSGGFAVMHEPEIQTPPKPSSAAATFESANAQPSLNSFAAETEAAAHLQPAANPEMLMVQATEAVQAAAPSPQRLASSLDLNHAQLEQLPGIAPPPSVNPAATQAAHNGFADVASSSGAAGRVATASSPVRGGKSAAGTSGSHATSDASPVFASPSGLTPGGVAVHDVGLTDRRSIGSSPASSASASLASDQDAFAALDRTSPAPQTTWIRTGAHHAEAGYLDSSLGWVSVRADSNGGAVHVALIPESREAASALCGHLAGLNAFIAASPSLSATVTLASPEAAGSLSGHAQQDGAAANGQHGQQQGRNPPEPVSNSPDLPGNFWGSSKAASPTEAGGYYALNGRGTHLSVMA